MTAPDALLPTYCVSFRSVLPFDRSETPLARLTLKPESRVGVKQPVEGFVFEVIGPPADDAPLPLPNNDRIFAGQSVEYFRALTSHLTALSCHAVIGDPKNLDNA